MRWVNLNSERGFTLIELLLVLIIIGILAGLVIPRFTNRTEQAQVAAASVDVRVNLATALDLYELDCSSYPTTAQNLQALLSEPTLPPIPNNWNGPYIRGGLPEDPWGNPYVYQSPCDRPLCDYQLESFGPDRAQGGGDDISNQNDSSS